MLLYGLFAVNTAVLVVVRNITTVFMIQIIAQFIIVGAIIFLKKQT